MREFQARFNYIAERNGTEPKHVEWPPCCPDGRAPLYPPDDYYDDALASNPDLGIELVNALKNHFCNSAIFTHFISDQAPGLAGEPPGNHPSDLLPNFTPQEMDCGLAALPPVDHSSMCLVLSILEARIPKLQHHLTDVECLSQPAFFRSGHGTGNGTPEEAWEKASTEFNCTWMTCAPCEEEFPPPCSAGWGVGQEQITRPCYNPLIQVIDSSFHSRSESEGHIKDSWVLNVSAIRGSMSIPESTRWPGRGHLFMAIQTPCQGSFDEEDDVDEGALPPDGVALNNTYSLYAEFEAAEGGSLYQTPTFGDTGDAMPWKPEIDVDGDGNIEPGDGDEPGVYPPDPPDCSNAPPEDYTECLCGDASRSNAWARGWDVTGVAATFSPEFDTSPDDGKECGDDCGTCVPGTPDGHLGSIRAYFPLGKLTNGKSAGYMQIRAQDITAKLGTRRALVFNMPEHFNELPGQGKVGRILAGDPPALHQLESGYDVIEFDGGAINGYLIKYYHKAGLAKDGDRFITLGVAPYTTIQISINHPTTPTELVVLSTGQNESYMRWTSHNGVLSFERGGAPGGQAAARIEERTREAIAGPPEGLSQRVTLIKDQNGIVASRTREVLRVFPWGEEIVERHTGPANAERSEFYTFDDNPSSPSYKRVLLMTNSDGYWVADAYDGEGRLSKRVSRYQLGAYNANLTLAQANNRHSEWVYVVGDNGGSPGEDLLTIRTDYIRNAVVGKHMDVVWSSPVSLASGVYWNPPQPVSSGSFFPGSGMREVWSIDVDLSTGLTNPWTLVGTNLLLSPHEISISFRDAEAPYRTHFSMSADGAFTHYYRTENTPAQTRTAETVSSRIHAGDFTAQTRVALPIGTASERRTTARGAPLDETTWDIQNPPADGSNATVISSSESDPVNELDAFGRVILTTYADGTTHQRIYDCCGLAAEVDRDGVRTEYDYDELKRPIEVRRQVGGTAQSPVFISTLYTYDAEGRVLTERRKGTDGTIMLQRTDTYDLHGDLFSSTDAAGRTTLYTRTLGQDEFVYSVTTLPDPDGPNPPIPAPPNEPPPFNVAAAYPDGTVTMTGGTASHTVQIEEFIETLHGQSMRVTRHSPDPVTQWVKSYADSLGRTRRVTYADGAFEESFYDNLGRMTASVDADGVRTMYASGYGEADAVTQLGQSIPVAPALDWTGSWSIVAVDSGGPTGSPNGVIDLAGHDRVQRTRTFLAQRSDGSQMITVRRTESAVWLTGGSATPYIASITDTSLDGLRTWSESGGRTSSSITAVFPADGLRVTETTAHTGATTTSESHFGRETCVSSVSAPPAAAFAGETCFEYDAHGRQTLVRRIIDPNDPTTDALVETLYSSGDDVLMVTEPEPTPANQQGRRRTEYFYDGAGRVTMVEHNDEPVYFQYFPTGAVEATWGFETNPVTMTYDSQGRISTLKTYKEAAGNDPANWGDFAKTEWVYDSQRGRLAQKLYADSTGPSYEYTPAGRLHLRRWARHSPLLPNQTLDTEYAYADTGEVASITYNDGTPAVAMTYDRAGRLSTVSDAAGIRELSYNDEGQLSNERFYADPNTGAASLVGVDITNSYGASGTRSDHEVELGQELVRIEYEYDDDGRLMQVRKGNMHATYGYHPATGRVSSIAYDAEYNQQWTRVAEGTRSHDLLGRLTEIDWRKTQANGALLERYRYRYDLHNRRMGVDYPDDSGWDYQYDDLGQLTQAYRWMAQRQVYYPGSQFAYEYDKIGNRVSASMGGDEWGNGSDMYTALYESNELNQYTSREVPGNLEVAGQKHPLAQSVLVNGQIAPLIQDYYNKRLEFDNTQQPLEEDVLIQEVPGDSVEYGAFFPESPEGFLYDLDGNLKRDGIWNYEWDGENRLKSMMMRPEIAEVRMGSSDHWIRLEFEYDWLGRRIGKHYLKGFNAPPDENKEPGSQTLELEHNQWQRFVYDGWHLSAVIQTAENQELLYIDQSFAWGPDLSDFRGGAGGIGGLAIYHDHAADAHQPPPGPMFPVFDGSGNLTRMFNVVENSNQEVVPYAIAKYEYGPFGELLSLQGEQGQRNPFRFSTKYTDAETGLVYYGYRYYNASTGRWLSRDPIEELDSLNLMVFVSNDPCDLIDPFGLEKYKKGAEDPPVHEDPGHGRHGTEDETFEDQNRHNLWSRYATKFARDDLGWTDAADHMDHFLGNDGSDYSIRLQKMIDDVPSAKGWYEYEKGLAMDFAETLPPGTHDITSGQVPQNQYNRKEESPNWYFAVGGYSAWGKGKVTVEKCGENGTDRKYKLEFKYKFQDRYNWDKNKTAQIGPYTISDKYMGRLHVVGLAREYNMFGEVTETIEWTKSSRSKKTPPPPSPGGGRR